MKNKSKANNSGKAVVVVIIVIVSVLVLMGLVSFILYNTLVKSGKVLNGTYTKDSTSFTIDAGENTYTLNTNGTEEKGKISDIKFDLDASSKDGKLVYTAKFDGNSTYSVTISLNASNKPMQVTLKSTKFSNDYVLDKKDS